jgi:hypothetical protein
MLRDFCTLLLLRRGDARWVGGEVRIEVCGRRFTVADHPSGVLVQDEDEQVAIVYKDPEEALAALGSRRRSRRAHGATAASTSKSTHARPRSSDG